MKNDAREASYQEHARCGVLDGGNEDGRVWMLCCKCGATSASHVVGGSSVTGAPVRAPGAHAVNSALLKAARELLYQVSLLVAAMESSRREAAVSALVRLETLARGLRSAIEEQ